MAGNSKEIQYAIERRGYVEIDDGASITTPIQLAHVEHENIFVFLKGELDYAGPAGKHAFGWKWSSSYTHEPAAVYFEGGVYDGNDSGQVSFFQVHPDSTKSPAKITLRRMDVYVTKGYAIDGNVVPKTGSIFCEDLTSYGAGCMRWISSSWPAFDWVIVDNWRRVGGGRLGASFMIKNGRRFQAGPIIDEGSPALQADLLNNYAGPIGLNLVNCTGLNYVHDWWMEPWGSWDTYAPGCWGFTVRADETSGNYRQHYCSLRAVTMNATGLGTGIKLYHGYGGDTSNDAASLRLDFTDSWKLVDDSTNFGGKIFPASDRASDNTPYDSADRADFDDINSGSFKQWWQVDSNAHPYQLYANRVNYIGSGSSYETNYASEPAQYDD